MTWAADTNAADTDADSLFGRLSALPADRRLTSTRTVGQWRADSRALADTLRVEPGEAVGFRLPNGEPWILALLALLVAGARPLPMAPNTPAGEFDRLLTSAGGRRALVFDGEWRLVGEPAAGAADRGVLLATSGSTGEPKLVLRPESTWVAEGLRYERAVHLSSTDRIVLPLPLNHAYALGWLAAALVTGTEVRPCPAAALSATTDELADGATIIALVPTLARLLVLRQHRRPVGAPKLRLAMIGAGAVDERLDREFEAAFGLTTGRNYGSTETGALFAGLADLPPLCVGEPMPGVDFRIVDGDLAVRLTGDTDWRQTGDIAATDEHGRVSILGRRFGAIRKGGRWIAPLEVEAVIREHPAVREAHVRAVRGRFVDEDTLVADIVADADEAELRAFAAGRLSDYKVPDRINLVAALARDAVGKVSYRQPNYRLAEPAVLFDALRAYRRSELLLALADLGLVDDLQAGADPDQLATMHNLPVDRVRWLLAIGADLGLLSTQDGRSSEAGLVDVIAMERRLSRTWLAREAIVDAVKAGRTRPFDRTGDPDLVPDYQRAMHGPHTAPRTRLGLRLLSDRVRGRVLEVSAGPGRYLAAGLAAGTLGGGHLLQLGHLAGPPAPTVAATLTVGEQIPPGKFDACVVTNGVHGPGRGADIAWLLSLLVPGGALLVDDIFLPDDGGPGTEIGLDWLTHGGVALPRLADLTAAVTTAGGAIVRTVRLTPPECCLILVTEEQ